MNNSSSLPSAEANSASDLVEGIFVEAGPERRTLRQVADVFVLAPQGIAQALPDSDRGCRAGAVEATVFEFGAEHRFRAHAGGQRGTAGKQTNAGAGREKDHQSEDCYSGHGVTSEHIVTKRYGLAQATLALLALLMFNPATADTSIELGPTFLSGDFAEGGAFIITESLSERLVVHLGYVSEQFVKTCDRIDCEFDVRENIFFGGQRTARLWIFDLGIGVDYFQNENRALGCRFTVGLLLGVRFTDRFSLRARHHSNAGSCSPNLGQDFVGLAWTF